MPNLSPLWAHSLSPPTPHHHSPLPVHDASPSILFMPPLWPNWWVNTNKLPSLHLSILSWSWKASLSLSLFHAAHPLIPLPSHPLLSLLCSLFIMFPFGSRASKSMAEFTGRLNSLPKGTWAMWMCAWMGLRQEKEEVDRKKEMWLTDMLNNWLTETPMVKVKEFDHPAEQKRSRSCWFQEVIVFRAKESKASPNWDVACVGRLNVKNRELECLKTNV